MKAKQSYSKMSFDIPSVIVLDPKTHKTISHSYTLISKWFIAIIFLPTFFRFFIIILSNKLSIDKLDLAYYFLLEKLTKLFWIVTEAKIPTCFYLSIKENAFTSYTFSKAHVNKIAISLSLLQIQFCKVTDWEMKHSQIQPSVSSYDWFSPSSLFQPHTDLVKPNSS